MDGAMGQEEDVVEAVLTCEGDFHDPELNIRIERFRHRLKDLLLTEKQRLQVKKIEPWNSVKVTFTIPRAAAIRLRQLAQNGNDALRQMGVLSVQIQGDTQISLTIAGRNNEPTQLLLRTPPTSQAGNSSLPLSMVATETGVQNSEDYGSSQGSSSDDLTRKNIVNYLRQGAGLRQNPIFDTILGTGTSSVPMLGFGMDLAQPLDSVAGSSASNTLFRPNSIASTSLQNSALKGSHINSSFPFTKTPGAFHPPVPRLSSSAGQSSATNSTHHIQSGNSSSGRLKGSLGHDAPSTASLSSPAPSAHMFQDNTNTFNPVGTFRLSTAASSSANVNSVPLHVPPSSPTSSFMIDLPPPPPYPSSSNANRQGKPVTSSSPLLVNLLQTDPLTATVGLASGNPNKPITAGEFNSGSPSKKRRSKKQNEGLMKPYLLNDSAASSRSGVHPWLFAPDVNVDHSSSSRVPENTVTSVDFIQSRTGMLAASHISDSFIMKLLPDSKSSFLLDRPGSESRSDELNSDFSSRSAIGAGYSSSNISHSNGQEPFPTDLDPFSMEIAAGKIINPYTGHLEPRDSVVDSVQVRVSDQTSYSHSDNFATQILARKAKELTSHENSVPNSSSQMLDVHVMKTAIPVHNSVSTSTAAALRSGGPLQASNDKLTSSVSTHHQNLIGESSVRETRDSPLSSSIYALTTKPWQEVEGNSDVGYKVSSNTVLNSSPRIVSSSMSSTIHKNFTPASVPLNGPLGGGHMIKHNPSQHHHHVVSSCSSGIRPPQGSVIYSSVTVSSSLPCPVSHQSFVAQTQSQQSLAAPAVIHVTSASLPSTCVSSSNSLTSHLGSTFSSSQPSHVQATNRIKIVETSHLPSNQHSQAASSDMVTGSVTPSTKQILLNSLPDKDMDSQNGTSSPPDNKTSSEGDENSNHSGLITDTLPEHSGTAALLEHSGVKAENHDSGIGSSSERSDDTPSEPGDNEFRSGQSSAEVEDSSKASLQKPVNCKLESKVNSSSNTITVGYMVSPSEGATQSKLNQIMDVSHISKNSMVISTSSSAVSDISHFFHTHVMSMDKQTGIVTGGAQPSSVRMGMENSNGQSSVSLPARVPENGQSSVSLPARVPENGQSPQDLGNISSMKINGPSSQSGIDKVVKAVTDKQHKKTRSSPKQNSKKGLMDVTTEHQKLQTEVLEKMNKLHQYAESTKETSNVPVKTNSSDKADSPDALSQRFSSSEDRPDQIIFDMEELVNGRTSGSGSSGVESRGGSNITSIYSKRSSPVNVNMLNHIYAPGLPLPRRLTESVQRLVKPLPAAETSVSYPQMRPCKSPGSGSSPRAGSSTGIQSSVRMSGVRSPGASMPKLIPSDKHSLISGGLDLAGISSVQCASTLTSDHTELVSYKQGSPALTADVLFQDTHCFSSSQNSPPNLLLDSKSYSSKMLSQSFPPHKSKDFKPNISHVNHGLFLSSSFNENNLPSFVHTSRHTRLPKARTESSPSSLQDGRFHLSNRSHQDILVSDHSASVSDASSQAKLVSQQWSAAQVPHSTVNSHVVENSSAYTSHSNAASPVMPVLQLGQESPLTPTMAWNMPSLSSQSPSCISSAKEISAVSLGSSVLLSATTLSKQNKHVPYSNIIVSSGTTSNAIAKSTTVSTSLPTSSPVSTAPLALGKTDGSPNYTAAPPKLLLSSLEMSANFKAKKVNICSNPSPSSSRSGPSTPQFSRNLFESVSGTLTHDSISSGKLEQSSENNSLDSIGHGNLQLSVYSTENASDSFGSVSVSQELKGDQLMKSLRHKSTDGGDKRSAAILSQSSKADLLKVSTVSKPIQTSDELSRSTFLSTEVVNLDFSLPSQACDALSLNIVSKKGTSCSGSVLKTSLSVSESLQESASIQTSQPSTSSLSSVASHISSGMSRTPDNLAETQTSTATGKEDVSKMSPGLSHSSMPLVKEPILEILASALGSSIANTSNISPCKSFIEKQVTPSESSWQFHTVEEDVTTQSKIVTIQSGPRRLQDYNQRQASLLHDSSAALNSDPFTRRPARKRKFTHSEDVTDDASSADPTPVKQEHMHGLGSGIKSSAKCLSADGGHLTKTHCNMNTESHAGKCNVQSKSPTILIKEPQEKEIETINRVTEAAQEETDSQNSTEKSRRMSACENKEHSSSKETRPHRSAISNTSFADESQSNQSSNEIKDTTCQESRLHRNTLESGTEGKERRLQRIGAASSTVEDQDLTRDDHSSRASSVDDRDNTLNDSKPHRGATDFLDDHLDSSSQLNLSVDDLATSGTELSFASSHGVPPDSKLDDGHKKSHRIRRQFYAYVPEKSIDQTYFDTPILSGRTRSKNKPSDMVGQDVAPSQDEIAPATNAIESHVHHPAGMHQAAVGKADGSTEKAGGKRPMRSARTKDNSQDQNASKRRRVQQHR